jgi:DNA-binding response OmpR family regulator
MRSSREPTLAARILLVEDEAPIRDGLTTRLSDEGFAVTAASTRAQALDAIREPYDIVVLDRRLPDGEGLDVLRALRRQDRATPVLVLSARGMTDDRIEGLEEGADDYVTKPFHLRELVARIRAVLARAAGGTERAGREVSIGPWSLDMAAHVLRRGRRTVPLARMEFELLRYLATNPGRVVSRTELIDRVWNGDLSPASRTLDFHVLALRRKIERPNAPPRHIVTVPGAGYRLDP